MTDNKIPGHILFHKFHAADGERIAAVAEFMVEHHLHRHLFRLVQGIFSHLSPGSVVKTAFSNGITAVKNTVTGTVSWFFESGKKVISAFANGIKPAFSGAVNAVKGGRTVETAAPALFAFMGSASSSGGLSAWR